MSAEITKDNINDILKDLGKEYRKRAGKQMPAEIVMTGSAAHDGIEHIDIHVQLRGTY